MAQLESVPGSTERGLALRPTINNMHAEALAAAPLAVAASAAAARSCSRRGAKPSHRGGFALL